MHKHLIIDIGNTLCKTAVFEDRQLKEIKSATNNYIDLEIKFQSKINTVYTFAINNIGGFAIPFDMKVTYEDGTSETLHKTPEIWQLNEKQVIMTLKTPKKIKEVTIDGGIFMDADESDNKWISK